MVITGVKVVGPHMSKAVGRQAGLQLFFTGPHTITHSIELITGRESHTEPILQLLEAINSGNFPQGMMRQVTKLALFIKPASPTAATTELVTHRTNNWMKEKMKILHRHYTEAITTLSNTPGDQLALKVATNWAHRRYSDRLDPATIKQTQSLLFDTEPASCFSPLFISLSVG